VTVTPVLGMLSVRFCFPADKATAVVNEIIEMTGDIRYDVAAKVRHQFVVCQSFNSLTTIVSEYMDQIDKELKDRTILENPDICPDVRSPK
jgi:ribosome-binding factor A